MTKNTFEKIVPDTSVAIEAILSKMLEKKQISFSEMIIHEAVLAELEHQANAGKASGFLGLNEIKKLRELSEKNNFTIRVAGTRPHATEIKYADIGEIDNLIRQLAFDEDATLITSDKVQARVAEAKGVKVEYIAVEIKELKLEKYFDKTTMSVHLMEDVVPHAKKGKPGEWEFARLSPKKLTQEEIREISKEIIENARMRPDGFIEIEREGSVIIQLGTYRIVICKPPLADRWEITAVKPIKQLTLDEYKLSDKLRARIERAEGILVAGAPGMGKSTFAQALATYYASKDKIVKTVEAPRDLQLGPEIMQYALSHGTTEEIHDILLLSRPDYTIYDEMRNTPDFNLFADLRLSGVGMVGVVHATRPIDAVQRFVGRIELGVIPHIIDTVIFIKNGMIDEVMSVEMTVKVPSGMTEADLARPVVAVTDFETGELEFEIYSYGEETVVIPVQKGNKAKSSVHELAAKSVENYFKRFSGSVKVEMVSDNRAIVYVPDDVISRVIGRKGEHIEMIEKELGIHIDIRELTDAKKVLRSIPFEVEYTKNDIIFYLENTMSNKDINIYGGDELLLSARASKKATIRVKRKSNTGMDVEDALRAGKARLGS